MNPEQFLNVENARKVAYQFFAAYYVLPEQAQIDNLPPLATALADLSPDASVLISQLKGELDIEQLTIDFSQLFVGPFKTLAAPYGSIYLETGRQVMGASTEDVISRYVNAGIEISKDFKDAPDHISAELEFMYFLVHQEVVALENQDKESASIFLQKQKSFLADHLTVWLPQFVQAVEDNAKTDFYKHVAKATLLFINQDFAALQSKDASLFID